MAHRILRIPADLAAELDRLAGDKRGASSYAIDVLRNEVRRRKQREALRVSAGAWKDHPELAGGGAAYVDRIRSEPDERFESVLRRNDG